ncbi:hypothetical protein E2C01_016417 [Portunus trituberculatus]|uniref:Uncharacterized protein n=1 Tax=Portunus trituberculatus TaxID=210409 RepID=A0A5B7DQU8_PORTR|nr:hypothetical protein [Portunus trituberculatus]
MSPSNKPQVTQVRGATYGTNKCRPAGVRALLEPRFLILYIAFEGGGKTAGNTEQYVTKPRPGIELGDGQAAVVASGRTSGRDEQ